MTPGDFFVSEVLGRPLGGQGEHVYFFVEKEGLNTADVAQLLASSYDVAVADIGYAGRKDKHAVTRQWFSVPVPMTRPTHWSVAHQKLRCLTSIRHSQKLRRGQLLGNRFRLRLQLQHAPGETLSRLSEWFPNRFGPQRFAEDNLTRAIAWLSNRRQRRRDRQVRDRQVEGWHLSVLRSFLFNEVLDARLAHGDLRKPLAGDVLQAGVPTAPLWGRGRTATSGHALEIEQQALAPHQEICDALEHAGVQQGRRALTVKPHSFKSVLSNATDLYLDFALPAGSYATTMLGCWFCLHDVAAERQLI